MEILCKLYLELANVVSDDCRSLRELKLLAERDHLDAEVAQLFQANGEAAAIVAARDAEVARLTAALQYARKIAKGKR